MSQDKVSGTEPRIIVINGNSVDLNLLDNLVGQSTAGSVFAGWEMKLKGGNHDSIFNKDEIENLKDSLYSKYKNKGSIGQKELDKILEQKKRSESYVSTNRLVEAFVEIRDNIKKIAPAQEHKPEPTPSNNPSQFSDTVVVNDDIDEIVAQQEARGLLKDAEYLNISDENLEKLSEELKNGKPDISAVKAYSSVLSKEIQKSVKDKSEKENDEPETQNSEQPIRKTPIRSKKSSETINLPPNVLAKYKNLKNKKYNVKYQANSDGTYSFIQTTGSDFKQKNIKVAIKNYDKEGNLLSINQTHNNGDVKLFQYDKDGKLTSLKKTFKNGDVRLFQYDKKGTNTTQMLIKPDGQVYAGVAGSNGKIAKMYLLKEMKGHKGNFTVVKNNNGTFSVIESSDKLQKEGIYSKEYKYNMDGKFVHMTKKRDVSKKPANQASKLNVNNSFSSKLLFPKKPVEPFINNYNGFNQKKTSDSVNNSKSTNKNQTVSGKSVHSSLPPSQASLIPGYENLLNYEYFPKTEAERAKFIKKEETSYPEKMRLCLADLRAVGVEFDIIQDNDGNYDALLNEKHCYLSNNRNGSNNKHVVFNKQGIIVKVSGDANGFGFTRTTNFVNGKPVVTSKQSLVKQNPRPKINPKTHVPYTVEEAFAKIQATAGNEVELIKTPNLTKWTIVRTDVNSKEMQGLKSIVYEFDAEGGLKYQLNNSAVDKSVLIGRKNSKTGNLEFKPFKNSAGILCEIPINVKQKCNEMMQANGKAKIVKGENTISIVQTTGQYLEKNNLAKIIHKYDPFGKLIEQEFTYNNGRTEKYYDSSKRGDDLAHIPNPIKINLPPQYQGKDTDTDQMIYGLKTEGPKYTAQKFASTLEENKAVLMKELRLTNEEYDNLCIIAMGIAEQETHFGQKKYNDTKENEHTQSDYDSRALWKKLANAYIWSDNDRAGHSQGISQINWNSANNDPVIKKRLERFGIKFFNNKDADPNSNLDGSISNQAIATMIILASNKNIAESSSWQQRLKNNNAKIKDPDKMLTTNDVIALLWNGAGGVVERMKSGETITIDTETITKTSTEYEYGQMKIKTKKLVGTFYAKAVRTYASEFFATPKSNSPGYLHTTQQDNIAGALGATRQDNTGMLGEVVFMPKTYRNAWRVAPKADENGKVIQPKQDVVDLIKTKSKLSSSYKMVLNELITDDYISFGKHGLTEKEAASLQDQDVKLLYIKDFKVSRNTKLSSEVNNLINSLGIKAYGEISSAQACREFAKDYLSLREFTVKNSSVSASSIMKNKRSRNPMDIRLLTGENALNYKINPAFYSGGIKQHTAKYVDLLDTDYPQFGVTKPKGVNPVLANGQYVSKEDRLYAEYGLDVATRIYESGGHCKNSTTTKLEYALGIDHMKIRGEGGRSLPNAKDMIEFYNAHPEIWNHLKYVDKNNGTSREFKATDINDLQCGLECVFIPGNGYEYEAGHNFTSDGFGECNADEHDNGQWTHFGNGKGEHGKLEVYKLSDRVVAINPNEYGNTTGRPVLLAIDLNPWFLTPEFKKIQAEYRKEHGMEMLKEEKPELW